MYTEEIVFIDSPQKQFKLLTANRLIKLGHVKDIMTSMLAGDWIPPIFVTRNNYIVDGQNRYAAFCNLCTSRHNPKVYLRVLYIDSKESPVTLAIKMNSGHKRWVSSDYLHAYSVLGIPTYLSLSYFLEKHPKLRIRSAIQVLLGTYNSESFIKGKLFIDPFNFDRAELQLSSLDQIEKVLNKKAKKYIYRRDIILAFVAIYPEITSWSSFINNLSNFQIPISDTKVAWLEAYRACL